MRKNDNIKNKSVARLLPAFRPDLRANKRAISSAPTKLFNHERSRRFGRGSAMALPSGLYQSKKVTLLDALDRVIDKGAYVDGELVLRVADIDLIFIGLRLMVTSVSRAERLRSGERMGAPANPIAQDLTAIKKLEQQLRDIEASIPRIIDAGNPEKVEQGVAKLVLTLIKLISKLMEREAVRRVDTGVLSESEIQKLGLTFKVLEKKIQEMKTIFGIKEELNLDLGPLGNLM